MTDKEKAKTGAERSKALRDKRKELGLKKLELWIKPETEQPIRDYAKKLNE